LDTWDIILRVNMYGCSEFPGGYPLTEGANRFECNDKQKGLGWIAASYFIFVVVFGGLILPTMLIGIVTISFEESFRQSEAEIKNQVEAKIMIQMVQEDMPNFFSDVRVELLKFVFTSIDVDNSGSLDINEVAPLIRYISTKHLNIELKNDDIRALVHLFDDDNTDDINFGELLVIIRYIIRARNMGKLIKRSSRGIAKDTMNSLDMATLNTPEHKDLLDRNDPTTLFLVDEQNKRNSIKEEIKKSLEELQDFKRRESQLIEAERRMSQMSMTEQSVRDSMSDESDGSSSNNSDSDSIKEMEIEKFSLSANRKKQKSSFIRNMVEDEVEDSPDVTPSSTPSKKAEKHRLRQEAKDARAKQKKAEKALVEAANLKVAVEAEKRAALEVEKKAAEELLAAKKREQEQESKDEQKGYIQPDEDISRRFSTRYSIEPTLSTIHSFTDDLTPELAPVKEQITQNQSNDDIQEEDEKDGKDKRNIFDAVNSDTENENDASTKGEENLEMSKKEAEEGAREEDLEEDPSKKMQRRLSLEVDNHIENLKMGNLLLTPNNKLPQLGGGNEDKHGEFKRSLGPPSPNGSPSPLSSLFRAGSTKETSQVEPSVSQTVSALESDDDNASVDRALELMMVEDHSPTPAHRGSQDLTIYNGGHDDDDDKSHHRHRHRHSHRRSHRDSHHDMHRDRSHSISTDKQIRMPTDVHTLQLLVKKLQSKVDSQRTMIVEQKKENKQLHRELQVQRLVSKKYADDLDRLQEMNDSLLKMMNSGSDVEEDDVEEYEPHYHHIGGTLDDEDDHSTDDYHLIDRHHHHPSDRRRSSGKKGKDKHHRKSKRVFGSKKISPYGDEVFDRAYVDAHRKPSIAASEDPALAESIAEKLHRMDEAQTSHYLGGGGDSKFKEVDVIATPWKDEESGQVLLDSEAYYAMSGSAEHETEPEQEVKPEIKLDDKPEIKPRAKPPRMSNKSRFSFRKTTPSADIVEKSIEETKHEISTHTPTVLSDGETTLDFPSLDTPTLRKKVISQESSDL
jgi:hypothetical protein